MLTYRKSTVNDKEAISAIIAERFGVRDDALENLDNRYLLCFDGDKLVAMSGCNQSDRFKGFEIDWSCTSKEYEGKGIMSDMFGMVMKDAKCPIYCSCWRMHDNDYCNLIKIMRKYGFTNAVPNRVKFSTRHNNCASICVECKDLSNCYCCKDLYIKETHYYD